MTAVPRATTRQLDTEQRIAIRRRVRNGEDCKALCREFGIDRYARRHVLSPPAVYAVEHYSRGDEVGCWHGVEQAGVRSIGKTRTFETLAEVEAHAVAFLAAGRRRRVTIEYLVHPSDGAWEVVRRRTITRVDTMPEDAWP